MVLGHLRRHREAGPALGRRRARYTTEGNDAVWNQRDRVLTGLFAVQLLAALIFGMVVVTTIDDGGAQPIAIDGAAAGDPAPGAGASGDTTSDGTTVEPTGDATARPATGTVESDAAAGGGATTPGSPDSSGTSGPAASEDDASADGPARSGAGGAAAPATGGPGTRTGVTDTEVQVGVLVTQTGAINFRSSAQATKAYFDMVNEAGGVNGRRIVYDIRDDGLSETRGQAAVRDMINNGVFAFAGFNAPLTEQSIVPIIEENQVPLVGAFAIPSTPMGYLFSAPYETYGRVGGNTLGEQGATTAGLVYLSNQVEATDRIIEESWRLGLQEQGLDLADGNVHAVGVEKTNFDDVVTSLRLAGVDAIGTILDATAMKRLEQSMARAGYDPVHVSSPFGGDPEVVDDPNVGGAFDGTFVLSDVHFLGSGVPEVERYESEVTRRFGADAELNWAGQHGWLGAKLFVEALAAAGDDPTRERVLEFMNSRQDHETGMTVPLSITADPNTHNRNNRCMRVGKVVNGKVQTVQDWTCPELTLGGDL